MVDMGTHKVKILNTGNITTKEYLTNYYAENINKPKKDHNSTIILCAIVVAKYKKAYLNNLTENQFQHLTETQHNEFLKLLQKSKSCSMENLVPGKHIQYTLN